MIDSEEHVLHTAELCSGIEEKKESIELAQQVAKSNGYETTQVRRRQDCSHENSGNLSAPKEYFFAFSLSLIK